MTQRIIVAVICGLTLLSAGPALRGQSISIALSEVGDAGNPASSAGFGAVDYDYAIGTFDVTLTQYCAFLNAVAKADPYGLYNSGLELSPSIEGITQSGVSGSFSYSVMGNSGNDPVTYVSWLDAARFCNWLQNGQPTTGVENASTTENGAYTLNGDTSSGQETKNANATWWIPSEDEWYKAACYDPTLNGGAGGYWTYATQSNTAPGNVIDNGTNEANLYNGVYSVTQSSIFSSTQNYLTPVGSYADSASYYRTYDQNGDVDQWNDAIINGKRGIRGDFWGGLTNTDPSGRNQTAPTFESNTVGFRVATVPEPNSAALILAGVFGFVILRGKSLKRVPLASCSAPPPPLQSRRFRTMFGSSRKNGGVLASTQC